MLLRRFYINLVVRMILILLTMAALSYVFHDLIERQFLFTFIVLAGFLLFQVVFLFRYLRKSDRQLSLFVQAISDQDFTLKFNGGKKPTPSRDLNEAFNTIIERYQSVTMEKESQSFLIYHLLQAIPAGIIVMNQEGRVLLRNRAMERLLALENVKSLEEIRIREPDFYKQVLQSGIPGNYVYQLSTSQGQKKYSVSVKTFLLFSSLQKLILVQDISKEVDAGELDAIQRLLRILTHEIMNSLTPVNSLAETITMLMTDQDGKLKAQENLSQKNYNDILESVLAIQERARGLDHFVNTFRTLTKLPEKIETEPVRVRGLLESVCKIMNTELADVEVKIQLEIEEMEIQIDAALIEQVLLNLITNSLTAMSETAQPQLFLKAFREVGSVIIQVEDNGAGIPPDRLGDIFMPFYSSKEKSSGIGLSFVKQILRMHDATIHVRSSLNEGSTFTMKFQDHSG
jgi:two-component system nitrogen regulation sensor histidine kinase NtrY